MRVLRATPRNVEDALSWRLKTPLNDIVFKRVSEKPVLWRHACLRVGVTALKPQMFVFDDGSRVYYVTCPKFPTCPVVIYFIEESPYVY